MSKFIDKFSAFAGKLSKNPYLIAMRDALMTLIPFLALGGISTFFAYVLFSTDSVIGIGANMDPTLLANIVEIFSRIGAGCINIMSLMLAALIPYFIGKQKGNSNPLVMAITGLSLFFVLQPTDGGSTYYGTKGVMLAMITGVTCGIFYHKLSQSEKLKIKIGENVPEAVTNSFNSLLTIIILLACYALVASVIKMITSMEIMEFINTVLQKPLVGFTASLPGALFYILANNVLWSFGIHPSAICSPLDAALTTAVLEGHIVNYSFVVTYGMVLGTGCLGGLIICLFLSKRKELKRLSEICIVPEIFNITEPLTFGTPIAYNLILCIPFILVPMINLVIAYFATAAGLISTLTNELTWSTPIILKGLIGSNGDIRNVIMELALLVLDVFLWMPFVKAYEKQLNKEETK